MLFINIDMDAIVNLDIKPLGGYCRNVWFAWRSCSSFHKERFVFTLLSESLGSSHLHKKIRKNYVLGKLN